MSTFKNCCEASRTRKKIRGWIRMTMRVGPPDRDIDVMGKIQKWRCLEKSHLLCFCSMLGEHSYNIMTLQESFSLLTFQLVTYTA